MTGMSPSVSRSGIMLLLSYLAQLISRRADTPVSLSAAVLLMLLYNPFIARNTGFLFSVCTTIGVRMLAEPLSEKSFILEKEKSTRYHRHPLCPGLQRRCMRLCLCRAANGFV